MAGVIHNERFPWVASTWIRAFAGMTGFWANLIGAESRWRRDTTQGGHGAPCPYTGREYVLRWIPACAGVFHDGDTAAAKDESQAIRIEGPGQVTDLTLTESTFGGMT